MLQPAQIAPATVNAPPSYQQLSAAHQAAPMLHRSVSAGGQLFAQQLSGSAQLLHSLSPQYQYQYSQEAPQFALDQHQLAGMRPQAVSQGTASGALPPVQSGEQRLQSSGHQYGQGSFYQDPSAALAAQQPLAVQYAESNAPQRAFLPRAASTPTLQHSMSLQGPLRQSRAQDAFAGAAQSAPVPVYAQPEPSYQLLNPGPALQDAALAPHSGPPFGGQYAQQQATPGGQLSPRRQERFDPGPLAQQEWQEGAAHDSRKDDKRTGPQTTITTEYSHEESEEVQSGSSTQLLSQGPQVSQGGSGLSPMPQLQQSGRSGSPTAPLPQPEVRLLCSTSLACDGP